MIQTVAVLTTFLFTFQATAFLPSRTTVRREPPAETLEGLKEQLQRAAHDTERGFRANRDDKIYVKEIIDMIAAFNAVQEPARDFYAYGDDDTPNNDSGTPLEPGISGRWTLLYTDAPDITTLDRSPWAELGRIGQECQPPVLKNVIEWKQPSWSNGLPFTGTQDTRILQKVVTTGKASPQSPARVQLDLSGLEVRSSDKSGSSSDFLEDVQSKGILPALLRQPLELNGSLSLPFGSFEVLYLDDELRINRTYQGYLAVNSRLNVGQEWF